MAKNMPPKPIPRKVFCPYHLKEETIYIYEFTLPGMFYSLSNGCDFMAERPECTRCREENSKFVPIPDEEPSGQS